jgi:hypothetical protein
MGAQLCPHLQTFRHPRPQVSQHSAPRSTRCVWAPFRTPIRESPRHLGASARLTVWFGSPQATPLLCLAVHRRTMANNIPPHILSAALRLCAITMWQYKRHPYHNRRVAITISGTANTYAYPSLHLGVSARSRCVARGAITGRPYMHLLCTSVSPRDHDVWLGAP